MALKKSVLCSDGNTAEYHKIESCNINWHLRTAEVILTSWRDSEARYGGMRQMTSKRFKWAGREFPFDNETGIVPQAYGIIKATPAWGESEDC